MSVNSSGGPPNSTRPRVTVLIPAYNAATHLRDAIDSILRQSFTDFELIVVDDASVDGTSAILASYNDPRIRVHRFSKNSGVSAARNMGISLALGEYIALLDADDIAYPKRLELQVAYLDQHPDVAVVGSLVDYIDEKGHGLYRSSPNHPQTMEEVANALAWGCCIINSAVTMRRDVVLKKGGYNGSDVAEDYDLWLKISDDYQLVNFPEYLSAYRTHGQQASFRKIRKMRRVTDITKINAFNRKKTLGLLPIDAQAPLPDYWARLRGVSYTLGGDYLGWAKEYSSLHRHDLSLRLSLLTIVNAPFCLEAYRSALVELSYVVLSRRNRSILAWQWSKFVNRKPRE